MAELDFVFYGERPALDFANTLRRRIDTRTAQVDLLAEKGVVSWFNAAHDRSSWGKELPLAVQDTTATDDEDRPPHPPSKSDILTAAQELRSIIVHLADTAAHNRTPDEQHPEARRNRENIAGHHTPIDLNAYTSGATLAYNIDQSGHLAPAATAESILTFIAQDAARLFTSAAAQRIKVCAHERCGILFEDRSNGQRRQWCSMKECGNRTKVARHAHKTTGT